jgi:hypothetical protein
VNRVYVQLKNNDIDASWKGAFKAGGISLVAAGVVLFLFFVALLILQTSPTLTPEMVLDNPLPPVSLYTLAVFGELLLLPGGLGLYVSLKQVKKGTMLMGTALWLMAVLSFLVSRTQVIALQSLSGGYQAATNQAMQTAYLVSAEHAIGLSNTFSNIALLLLGIASIIIGSVMLKGFFGKGVGYLVVISGALTLIGALGILFEPMTILVLFGLTLGAVWQIIVGVKLYKLG